MAEFHIGDRVRVLYQGRELGGLVEKILPPNTEHQPVLYLVCGQHWPEIMLDYDLTDVQRSWWMVMERTVNDLLVAAKEAENLQAEVIKLRFPPEKVRWLSDQINEVRRLIGREP